MQWVTVWLAKVSSMITGNVAYCCEKKLLDTPKLSCKDPDGLKSLAILMEKSSATLEDMGDFATLNSLGAIRTLMDKFPEEMQRDWIKWSRKVLKETGKQAKFSELVDFVKNEADEVNSLYGRAFYSAATQSNLRSKKQQCLVPQLLLKT